MQGRVVPGGAMTPPDFGRSVNPISTRGAPPNNTGTPGFSDLPMALKWAFKVFDCKMLPFVQFLSF